MDYAPVFYCITLRRSVSMLQNQLLHRSERALIRLVLMKTLLCQCQHLLASPASTENACGWAAGCSNDI